MDLTVIIVNYNVKYFLEQCLLSVLKASRDLEIEIIVVDNHSVDGSVQMLNEKFPQVTVISNKTNYGFARANNQAIKISGGKYILLLNPDTIIEEDTFTKCLNYLDSNPDAGSIGVRMINGKGKYLPESKRGLPTPMTAFYKIFGFASMFPASRKFSKYYLGHLNSNETNEVDVLSGAFMMIRRSALEKTGLLDERFFMYGEDIDLSYRLKLSGYRNIYFPETTIIHFKGESTRKNSINYVILFYRAMIFFARKHFSDKKARYFIGFIYLAIWIRASISIIRRLFLKFINPLLDAIIIYSGFYLFLPVWEKYHFKDAGGYPDIYVKFVVPAYIFIWIMASFINTGYQRRIKLTGILRSVFVGSLVIIVIYALLPESMRFSRALIIIGSVWTVFSMLISRSILSMMLPGEFQIEIFNLKRRILIAGSITESKRVLNIIGHTHLRPELIGFVNPSDCIVEQGFIGNIEQIEEIVRINRIDELIFCASDMSAKQIIETMLRFHNADIDYMIAPPECLSVIGSNSTETTGNLYSLHFNTLSRLTNRLKKRVFDICCSLAMLCISPVLIFIVDQPLFFFVNIVRIIIGNSSWIGYNTNTSGSHKDLPPIKPGVLTPVENLSINDSDTEFIEKSNLQYAKDYRAVNDLRIIMGGLKNLGRKPPVLTKS